MAPVLQAEGSPVLGPRGATRLRPVDSLSRGTTMRVKETKGPEFRRPKGREEGEARGQRSGDPQGPRPKGPPAPGTHTHKEMLLRGGEGAPVSPDPETVPVLRSWTENHPYSRGLG